MRHPAAAFLLLCRVISWHFNPYSHGTPLIEVKDRAAAQILEFQSHVCWLQRVVGGRGAGTDRAEAREYPRDGHHRCVSSPPPAPHAPPGPGCGGCCGERDVAGRAGGLRPVETLSKTRACRTVIYLANCQLPSPFQVVFGLILSTANGEVRPADAFSDRFSQQVRQR